MSLDASKEYMKKHAIYPRISFKDKAEHIVTLVKEKIDVIPGPEGDKEGMNYLVKESGELKTFFTSSAFLISSLAAYDIGDEVSIQMVVKKINGQARTGYKVSKEGDAVGEVELDKEEQQENGN